MNFCGAKALTKKVKSGNGVAHRSRGSLSKLHVEHLPAAMKTQPVEHGACVLASSRLGLPSGTERERLEPLPAGVGAASQLCLFTQCTQEP